MDYHLPEIPGIDWETAHRYMPEKDVLLIVLKEFVCSAEKQVQRLKEYRDLLLHQQNPENFAAYRIQAHAMKASLRSFGSDLYDLAFSLETAAREEDLSPVERDTDAFCEAFLRLAERLKVITGECDTGLKYDHDTFFALVDRVDAAMQSFEISELQETFRTIQSMELPEQYKEIVREMEPAVRDLEADTVADCCARLRGQHEICSNC